MRQHRFRPGRWKRAVVGVLPRQKPVSHKNDSCPGVRQRKKTAIVPSPSNVSANSPVSSVSMAHSIACADK
ncbi:hypothetical protein P9199_06955 [Geobacillus stearothermophilus]|uniref:hypothetical protein n=1 Tax=Geobacillus TaxID=129337 RepID=UPI002AC8A347|nr:MULTISPECIES: hypothetical protein [Geobacillus]MED4269933.1 hypothetical protein [Geobacillus stearothermophilus]WPZ17921.1 hypothetical protein UM396_15285 [Geobacillus subterraneus]